jgi:arylsulfatase A-like enzyme
VVRLYGRQAIAHGDPTHGWDRQRELTFARQKELGVIPADAELTERHAEIPAWDDMAEELKPVLERQMEIYAGFLSHADHHVGRLLDAIEQLGVLDDTLIYVIVGDNGASAEGTLQGSFNEMINFNAMAALETPAFMAERLDKFGGPESYTTTRSAGRGRWTDDGAAALSSTLTRDWSSGP